MSRLRSLSTAFWSDPFVEELSPTEKLLFVYLITNEKTNMLGIYEASIKKISFETGISEKEVNDALKRFEKLGKVKYINNYVLLVNFLKHQNFNTNMKKSAIDVYNNLPNELKISDLNISKVNPSEGFERLSKGLLMVRKIEHEVEVEIEVETEEEIEDEIVVLDVYPTFEDFWDLYDKKTGKPTAEKKWQKLNQQEKELIMAYIPNYKRSQPDKKYRKNPETFLNNKGWEDELIFNNKSTDNEQKSRLRAIANEITSANGVTKRIS